jgi:RNA polymerase sigma-70 factor (ECF subfamily)
MLPPVRLSRSSYRGRGVLIDSTDNPPSPAAYEDAELLSRIVGRDEAGLAQAIQLYAGQIKAICLRICVDELEADEVVSVVFWELWHGVRKVDLNRGSLRTYLLTLARSRAIDRQRAAAARVKNCQKYLESQRSHCMTNQEEGVEAHMGKERSQELREAIAGLPAAQKSALELAFFDGLTHREVAERQSLPLGTIKTNIRRGLMQLRKMMVEFAGQERELT